MKLTEYIEALPEPIKNRKLWKISIITWLIFPFPGLDHIPTPDVGPLSFFTGPLSLGYSLLSLSIEFYNQTLQLGNLPTARTVEFFAQVVFFNTKWFLLIFLAVILFSEIEELKD